MNHAVKFMPVATVVALLFITITIPAVIPNSGDPLSFSQILFQMDGTERGWIAEARVVLLVACAFMVAAIITHTTFVIGIRRRLAAAAFWLCAVIGLAALIVFHLGWVSILDADRARLGNSWYFAYGSMVLLLADRVLLQRIVGKSRS
jgi:hypothetical protein